MVDNHNLDDSEGISEPPHPRSFIESSKSSSDFENRLVLPAVEESRGDTRWYGPSGPGTDIRICRKCEGNVTPNTRSFFLFMGFFLKV